MVCFIMCLDLCLHKVFYIGLIFLMFLGYSVSFWLVKFRISLLHANFDPVRMLFGIAVNLWVKLW